MVATPQCSNCFYSFIAPADADSIVAPAGSVSPVVRFAGKRFCNRQAPTASNTNPNAWLWPLVNDDFWCGEGADDATGQAYANSVNSVPGTGGAGSGYLATSATSLTIASSGSLAATTQLNLAYSVGARVRLTSTGTAAWMEGVVTNYSAAGVLTFTADTASGSGTHTDWDINLAGVPGAAGANGSNGTNGLNAPQWFVNPAPGDGADGDFAFTVSGGVCTGIQIKTGGVWTTQFSHFQA